MITCYEYDRLPTSGSLRAALEAHYGECGVPYYNLIRGGVQFNQYVGVLQVGATTIEVLPKIDRVTGDADRWRNVLIDMLRKVVGMRLETTDHAALRVKPNSILDLYMELLLTEVAYLMRQGLIKSYRKTEGNRTALKGKLLFAQNIRHNLVHAERFYVQHSTYDRKNKFNCILRQALVLVARLSVQVQVRARVAQLLLDFPELTELAVSESLFERLPWSRKTEGYRTAIGIARLLLLNYHPDIRGGREDVLALMFDMNQLWERYVIQTLRGTAPADWTVDGQCKHIFWETEGLHPVSIKPDILLQGPDDRTIVLDTKWKVIDGRPSDHDLRQLFAYQHRCKAVHGYLVYPDLATQSRLGKFQASDYHCHIMSVKVIDNDGRLSGQLGEDLWELLRVE